MRARARGNSSIGTSGRGRHSAREVRCVYTCGCSDGAVAGPHQARPQSVRFNTWVSSSSLPRVRSGVARTERSSASAALWSPALACARLHAVARGCTRLRAIAGERERWAACASRDAHTRAVGARASGGCDTGGASERTPKTPISSRGRAIVAHTMCGCVHRPWPTRGCPRLPACRRPRPANAPAVQPPPAPALAAHRPTAG